MLVAHRFEPDHFGASAPSRPVPVPVGQLASSDDQDDVRRQRPREASQPAAQSHGEVQCVEDHDRTPALRGVLEVHEQLVRQLGRRVAVEVVIVRGQLRLSEAEKRVHRLRAHDVDHERGTRHEARRALERELRRRVADRLSAGRVLLRGLQDLVVDAGLKLAKAPQAGRDRRKLDALLAEVVGPPFQQVHCGGDGRPFGERARHPVASAGEPVHTEQAGLADRADALHDHDPPRRLRCLQDGVEQPASVLCVGEEVRELLVPGVGRLPVTPPAVPPASKTLEHVHAPHP
jgi:hypothetical protein